MPWNPFTASAKSFLGVDIGTSAIKIVELSRLGERKKLENYGEIQARVLYERPFRTFEKSTLSLSAGDVARAILAVLKESGMKTRKTHFSIPDFSTFFTSFQLPAMSEEELPQAVHYEARQHIPLPASEVALDWQIIGKQFSGQQVSKLNILLVAVPNEIIQQYQEIAQKAGLELLTLEAEVFALARALLLEDKQIAALIDIGARSTTISIMDKGILKISHSFDTSGNDFTDLISRGLNVDQATAETLKRKQGILEGAETRKILLPLVDLIVQEARKIFQNFVQAEQKEPRTLVLAGGSALLPGLTEYFSRELQKPAEIANPFANLFYPPILEETLKAMGPSYAIAVGAALRGLE